MPFFFAPECTVKQSHCAKLFGKGRQGQHNSARRLQRKINGLKKRAETIVSVRDLQRETILLHLSKRKRCKSPELRRNSVNNNASHKTTNRGELAEKVNDLQDWSPWEKSLSLTLFYLPLWLCKFTHCGINQVLLVLLYCLLLQGPEVRMIRTDWRP